ncbi:MAG: hypothetical protein IT381_11805 [Deltaproteobacteria bacterium]|nr:hypothetical protein [Deltaproteobacteria bacterium]
MKVGAGPQTFDAALLEAMSASVPCPFMAAMTKEGRLPVDRDGMVDFAALRAALKQVGISFTLREVLVRGTKSAETERLKQAGSLLAGMEVNALNITKLHDTPLMHSGDLKIRRGGFHQERLDWLLGFSSDGKTLSLKDVAAAEKAAAKADPGFKGQAIAVVELSALVRLFGTKNAAGELSMTKDALVSLFRDAKFPDGFKKGSVGAPGLLANIATIAFHQIFSSSGRSAASLDKAVGRSAAMDQSAISGLGKAICPAGMRPAIPPATDAQLQALHTKA